MSLRKQALGAVQLWYEARVRYGRARYARLAPRKVSVVPAERSRDPDPLAQAKKDRPENWTRRKVREVLGEDGRPVLDALGNPVVETVDLADVLTGDGVETRPSPRAQVPSGQGAALEVVERRGPRQPMTRPNDPLTFINRTMMRVALVDPIAHEVLEMWGAGYSRQAMTEEFDRQAEESERRGRTPRRTGTGKTAMEVYFEKGLAIVQFALVVRPHYGSSEATYERQCTAADLGIDTLTGQRLNSLASSAQCP